MSDQIYELQIKKLQSEIQEELESYKESEQVAILTRIASDLKQGYHQKGICNLKKILGFPNWWIVLAIGIAIPIIFYILLIWISLIVE